MALRIACDLDGTLADMESALQREAERLFGPNVDLRARADVPDAVDDEGDPEATKLDEMVRLKADPASHGNEAEPVSEGTEADAAFEETEAERTFEGTVANVAAARAEGGRKRPLTDRQVRQLWAHVRRLDNFWTTLEEIEPGAVARFAALASLHGWEVIFLTQRPATGGDTSQTQSQRWLAAHGFEFPAVFVMNGSRGKVADALRLDVVIDDRPDNCRDVAADSNARAILISRRDAGSAQAGARGLGITVVRSFAESLESLLQLMAQRSASRSLVSRVRAAIGI